MSIGTAGLGETGECTRVGLGRGEPVSLRCLGVQMWMKLYDTSGLLHLHRRVGVSLPPSVYKYKYTRRWRSIEDDRVSVLTYEIITQITVLVDTAALEG